MAAITPAPHNFTGKREWGFHYDKSEKNCTTCGMLGKYHPVVADPVQAIRDWHDERTREALEKATSPDMEAFLAPPARKPWWWYR